MALTRNDVDEPEKRQGRAGEPERHPKSAHRLLHSMRQRAGEPEMQASHGEPEACTGFYTQCGTGLENQQKIPRAHTGFYTQCGKGLENQRHRDAQAFTLRAAEGWGTRENPKSTHRLLHSVWQRAGEPETHDTHRLLHSERHRAGEPERHSECTHRLLRSMQHREDGTNGICSYQPLHSYEEHASVTSHVFRMRDLEHIGLKRRGFFFSDGFLMIT